jgi:hypothetical protein
MQGHTYFLTFCLAAIPWILQAAELPIVFGRSGQQVTLADCGPTDEIVGPVALWTFGRRWGEPMVPKNGAVELIAPHVRVPVVFRMLPTSGNTTALCELVVYPDAPLSWDKDTQFVAVGTPQWFDSWSQAIGFPIKKFERLELLLSTSSWRMSEKPALLVLGQQAAGNDLVVIRRLAAENKINVLVLTSDWFSDNETASGEFVMSPQHVSGPLFDLQGQKWSTHPTFRQPVLRILNRQTWIAGPSHPLVEELRAAETENKGVQTVFSYLPWQQVLGRTEMADEMFRRLLTETAKGTTRCAALDDCWRLLYPAASDIQAADRPVLAAALKSATTDTIREAESPKIQGYVLDLRDNTLPPADFFEAPGAINAIESQVSLESPLLILGDKPILDDWKWLELDRPRHRSPRSGVLWWPDNSLPPSMDSQLHLMQAFTEWNISLADTAHETDHANHANE